LNERRSEARQVRSRRRFRWRWVLLGVALLALALVIVVRRRTPGSALPPDALIVSPRKGTLAIDIFETGVIEPNERVEIKSKVAGQVIEVRIQPGDTVRRGDLLLRLDPMDYEREVARNEAAIEQARAGVDFARQQLERVRGSVREQVSPRFELESAEHQVRLNQAALRSAEVMLSAARDSVRYTSILAPIDGTVIQRAADVGEVVTPGVVATFEGRSLLTIADLSKLLVEVELNQIDIARVKVGGRATAQLDALPGQHFAAEVTRVAVASTKVPGRDVELFPIELTLLARDPAIRPGMTADITLHISELAGVLSLPIEAVSKDGARSMVTRVVSLPNGETLKEKVEVQVGARNDRELEVVSGLGEADRVLIDPPSAAQNETAL
jgi:HlyD family secretion protein/macrolide-specific efflux system membrane fusion protein